MQDWQNNTVAELIHGPCDGREILLPPGEKVVEVIEVPLIVDMTSDWCQMIYQGFDSRKLPIRLGIYYRDGGTMRLHTGLPTTVKFRYQETRDEKEPVE